MEIIAVESFPPFVLLNKTVLTADVAEGADTLSIEDDSEFDTDHPILVGEPGQDGSEIRLPNGIGDESIDLTGSLLDHPHQKGTVVYKLRAHKVRIYRAANVDGSRPIDADDYSLLTTILKVGDRMQIEYEDSTGGSDYWYLSTEYNDMSGSPVETAKDTTKAVRGGNYGHYATIDDVINETFPAGNDNIPESFVAEKRDIAEDEVKGAISQKYTLPLSKIPKTVKQATMLIASGWLLMKAWGVGEEGTNKEANAKLKAGRDLLKKIINGEITLLDETEAALGEQTSQCRGYPDGTETDDEARKFSMSDTY